MTAVEVPGEAARLVRRLETAGRHLDAARTTRSAPASPQDQLPRDLPPREGARIDDVDDEVRALLIPAAERLADLVALARALADGTLPDEAAATAANAIAATQPARRPR